MNLFMNLLWLLLGGIFTAVEYFQSFDDDNDYRYPFWSANPQNVFAGIVSIWKRG